LFREVLKKPKSFLYNTGLPTESKPDVKLNDLCHGIFALLMLPSI